jgi:hypothetical protein
MKSYLRGAGAFISTGRFATADKAVKPIFGSLGRESFEYEALKVSGIEAVKEELKENWR